jgi:hypothetical protein
VQPLGAIFHHSQQGLSMEYKIICNLGHLSVTSDVTQCPNKSCRSKICWILDMEEDFQVSYKFENQPIEKVLIHSKILESALPEIRRTLNEEGVKYTLTIHPYSKSTSKIKGNIWFLMPSYSMIPSTISLGTELVLKTQRVSHYSNEKFRFGTLVHIKFESKYAVSAKKSRKFNKDMKDWVNSFGTNVKIVRYVRDKFREQLPYMGTNDPYFDAQVGNLI